MPDGVVPVRGWLLIAATTACVALLLRGSVGLALFGVSLLNGTFEERTPPVLLAIEPWFVLGGLAYGGMALHLRKGRAAGLLSR